MKISLKNSIYTLRTVSYNTTNNFTKEERCRWWKKVKKWPGPIAQNCYSRIKPRVAPPIFTGYNPSKDQSQRLSPDIHKPSHLFAGNEHSQPEASTCMHFFHRFISPMWPFYWSLKQGDNHASPQFFLWHTMQNSRPFLTFYQFYQHYLLTHCGSKLLPAEFTHKSTNWIFGQVSSGKNSFPWVSFGPIQSRFSGAHSTCLIRLSHLAWAEHLNHMLLGPITVTWFSIKVTIRASGHLAPSNPVINIFGR